MANRSALAQVRAISVGFSANIPGYLLDASDRIVAAWRARAARMHPSDFADCAEPVRYTLLAALCWTRQAELVDGLAELLIGLIHRINARAHRHESRQARAARARHASGESPTQIARAGELCELSELTAAGVRAATRRVARKSAGYAYGRP